MSAEIIDFGDWNADLMEYEDDEDSFVERVFDETDRQLFDNQKNIFSLLIESVPALCELANSLTKSQRLQLVFSDEVKAKIADGTYRLMKRKDIDNVFKAIVVDEQGKARAIADLKYEDVIGVADPSKIIAAMQGMAIQEQLKDISNTLEDMNKSLENVLAGQYNDRLAMYYSGEAIYKEALATTDPAQRKMLTMSAISRLTDAISAIGTTLEYDINSVCDSYIESKNRFDLKYDELCKKITTINNSFQTIHEAVYLKSAIYYQEGEYSALATVLSAYKEFLKRNLTEEKASVLYLADMNEMDLEGIWNIRQNKLLESIDVTNDLLKSKIDYKLEVAKEDIA